MSDERTTKRQLLEELHALRERVAELEARAVDAPCRGGLRDYRTLVESSADVIWTTDRRHRYTYLSPATELLLGYTPEEGVGRHILLGLSKESRRRAREAFQMMRGATNENARGFHRRAELEHYRKDGSKVWLEVVARPVFGPDGQRLGLMGVSRDIADRKLAEERLLRSESKIRHVLENASLLAVSLDIKGHITFANAQFLTLAGYCREEVLGRAWFETFVSPDRRDDLERMFRGAMAGPRDGAGAYARFENNILTKHGQRLTVLWSNVIDQDEDDKPSGMTCLGIDVTRMRRTQTELARSELRYRRLFEDAALGIFVTEGTTEENWTIIDLNKAGQALLGYSREEFLGLHPSTVIHPEDLGALPLTSTLSRPETGEPLRFERRYRRKDGSWLPAQVTLKRIPGTHQHLVMFQDTSESKRAKAELNDFRVLLSAMADNLIDMLWAKDLNGRYLFANKAAREYLLCSDDMDPLGKTDAFSPSASASRARPTPSATCAWTRTRSCSTPCGPAASSRTD